MDKSIEAAAAAYEEAFGNCGGRDGHISGLRAAIAAYRDAEAKRSDRCEHCGYIVTSYRSGCPGCGAPQCCQRCCDKAEIERLNENIKTLLANHQTVRAKLEAAERDAERYRYLRGYGYDVDSFGIYWDVSFERLGKAEMGDSVDIERAGESLDEAIDSARGGERD